MKKPRRKRTAAEKTAKKQRRAEFMTIFINGKQKRIRRPPTIDGMDVNEFIRGNADKLWLHQNEMWEDIVFEGGEDPEEVCVSYWEPEDDPF